MSKYLDKLRNDPRVASVSDERNTTDGYWIYLQAGYVCDSTDTGTVHEYTISELRRAMAEVRKV